MFQVTRRKATKHGTLHAYIDHGCHCDMCRENMISYRRKKVAKRKGSADTPHGTCAGYVRWGCRCVDCKKANATYAKKYSRTRQGKAANSRAGKRWRTKNKEKTSAHSKVFNAIRCGELVRSNVCERCDSVGVTEATHTDYSKPLDVEWLCYSCHRIKDGLAVD